MTASVLRALPAGVLLLAMRPGLPPAGWGRRIIVLGLLNIGVFFPLLFIAAYRLPGGLAAVVGAVQPLVVIALTTLFRSGRSSPLQVCCGVAALAGVALVSLTGRTVFDPVGLAAVTLGTIAMAGGILLTRRWGRPPQLHPLTLTAWQLIVGGAVITPLIPLLDHGPWQPTPAAWAGYAWLTLAGGAVAYTLWFRGARALPSASVALLGVLSPVTAALLGWIVLGQTLTGLQLLGFAIALTGSTAGQLAPTPRHDESLECAGTGVPGE